MISIFEKRTFRKIPKSKIKREREKIMAEWNTLEHYLIDTLFSYDWDSNEEFKQTPIFANFNMIWINFAKQWNDNPKHVLGVNPRAFFEANCKH